MNPECPNCEHVTEVMWVNDGVITFGCWNCGEIIEELAPATDQGNDQ